MKNNPKKIYPLKGTSKERVAIFMEKFLKERGSLMKKLARE